MCWIVLALAVILLPAVGSDYDLLLICRFKDELDAGINTGIVSAMARSGAVGRFVFAAAFAAVGVISACANTCDYGY